MKHTSLYETFDSGSLDRS